MKIMILGGDGYLGWPTSMSFALNNHKVLIIDNLSKRKLEKRLGIKPLIPIAALDRRILTFKLITGKTMDFALGSVNDYRFISSVLKKFKPEAIIHFGEQPSAPYSMINVDSAVETQQNNVLGTLKLLFAIRDNCPSAHLIKLGTMGEYGTPNIPIEEGFITVRHRGRVARLPFPKQAGSFYHLSKVHDSNNIMFACKTWGLSSTDLNQGVVYGTDTPETVLHKDLETSFHYDDVFGTVLNRFCVEAVLNSPLTLYGKGLQKRSFLHITDTIRCIAITAANPPKKGEYRVFNQYSEVFTLEDLAKTVQHCAGKVRLKPDIIHIDNPRSESEDHFYQPINSLLKSLGFRPKKLTETLICSILQKIIIYKDNINKRKILPRILWRTS